MNEGLFGIAGASSAGSGSILSSSSLSAFPTMPRPERIYMNGAAASQNIAPNLAANDGGRFSLPSSTTSYITYYNKSNTSVWSKNHANINAAATGWQGLCIDESESAVYCLVQNGVATAYVAKIDIASGTVTSIGTHTTQFSGNALYSMRKIGTNIVCGYNAQQYSFSCTTGAITSAAANIVQNGGTIPYNQPSSYQTQDGSIWALFRLGYGGVLTPPTLQLIRGGRSIDVQLINEPYREAASGHCAMYLPFCGVLYICPFTTNFRNYSFGSYQGSCSMVWRIEDFDKYLKDVADYLSMPEY